MRKNLVLGLATVTAGLSAGVFFAFSVAVNPGLSKMADESYVAAMQHINKVIENPVFFLAFFGAALLLPLSTYLFRVDRSQLRYKLLMGAAVLYILGPFGITVVGNVPLNNKLATVPLATASQQEIAKARSDYEKPWNAWHEARTVTSVAAFGLVIAACLAPTALTKNKKN